MLHSLAGRPENRSQARILALLRDDGPLSRAQLGERLEVSRTTVASEVGRLVELGLVEEGGPAASRGGRRSTLVDLAGDLRFVGISIGATGLSVAVTDGRLTRCWACAPLSPTYDGGPRRCSPRPSTRSRGLRGRAGRRAPRGRGVGVPGPVDFDRGVPMSPPIMPGWDAYPVRDTLARELSCPVVLDNDVNVMALGELQAGVARSATDYLFVKIGTGIGCGIIAGGRLFRGVDGCAGDIGHIRVEEFGPTCACGNTGCLEAFAGGAALARDATSAARSGGPGHSPPVLQENGEVTAADIAGSGRRGRRGGESSSIRDSGRRVGQVLAGLVSFFNPGLIVVGGRVTGLGHGLLAEIRGTTYRSRSRSPPGTCRSCSASSATRPG